MITKKKAEVKKTSALAQNGDVLVDPDAKANFWKPKVVDETRIGKFLGKSTTQYGEVINLETADGLAQIPISVVLKKVDWDKHVGKTLFFQYKGTIKRYRTFLVKLVAVQ